MHDIGARIISGSPVNREKRMMLCSEEALSSAGGGDVILDVLADLISFFRAWVGVDREDPNRGALRRQGSSQVMRSKVSPPRDDEIGKEVDQHCRLAGRKLITYLGQNKRPTWRAFRAPVSDRAQSTEPVGLDARGLKCRGNMWHPQKAIKQ